MEKGGGYPILDRNVHNNTFPSITSFPICPTTCIDTISFPQWFGGRFRPTQSTCGEIIVGFHVLGCWHPGRGRLRHIVASANGPYTQPSHTIVAWVGVVMVIPLRPKRCVGPMPKYLSLLPLTQGQMLTSYSPVNIWHYPCRTPTWNTHGERVNESELREGLLKHWPFWP